MDSRSQRVCLLVAAAIAMTVTCDAQISAHSHAKPATPLTWRVPVAASGALGKPVLSADDGGDAVAQDRQGNVYPAAEQVQVDSRDGKLMGRIDAPERPIDLIFGGADRRTLFILTHDSLYAVETKNAGL